MPEFVENLNGISTTTRADGVLSPRTPSPSNSNTLPRCRKKRGKLNFIQPTPVASFGPSFTANSAPQTSANTASQNSESQNSRSFIRVCQRAKRVRFYRNGDQFFKGIWYAITPDRIRSFESLLEDLTRSLDDLINLPHGVRHIFSADGQKKIVELSQLVDGCSYVCASNEMFKKVDYENAREPIWKYGSIKQSRVEEAALSLGATPGTVEPNDFVKPKIVTIIRNGVKPRKIVRLLLNKRTAPSFNQVLSDITVAVKLDSGAVKKLYTIEGQEVGTNIFFRSWQFSPWTHRCEIVPMSGI